MPAAVPTVAAFKEFSKLVDSETDNTIERCINIGVNQVSRICATSYSSLPESDEIEEAVFIIALARLNSKGFPSRAIRESIEGEVLSLLSGHIDLVKQTAYVKDGDL